MSEATRVLMAEDSDRDAELVVRELKRSGLKFESRRVQTEEDFRRALDEFHPQIILSDFSMPGFGGVAALRICKESGIDIPFVFVSGTIGEDVAVEAMKAGADDYVMKTNLFRLGPTVQRALREAELRSGGRFAEAALRRAQSIAKLAHVITGPDGSFDSWSQTFPTLHGVSADQMPGSTREWLSLVHPDDRETVRAKAIEGGRTGSRFEFEYRLNRADGALIHIRQVSEPLNSVVDTSWGLRWFGTLQDVTSQKRAEAERRSMHQLLDNIVDNIPTAVQLKSVEDGYRIVLWNKAAESIYGLPREAAIGRNVHDLWPKPDAERFHAADLELIAGGGSQDFPDRPAQTKDRGEIRVHLRKVALLDSDGKATHLLAIADDITAQLADQARLRESEARFRSLTKLSSDWFWEQDEQYRFTGFSGGDQDGGWGKDQLGTRGLRRWELPGVAPLNGSWDEHKALLDARKPFRDFEYRRVMGDGTLQYIAASGEPMFDADSRFKGYRGVATDITERKRADERIRRLNRVYAVLSGINALIVRVRNREELFKEACRIAVHAGGFKLAWIGALHPAMGTMQVVASHGAGEGYIELMPLGQGRAADGGRSLSMQAITDRKAMISDDMTRDPRVMLRRESLARGFHSLAILPLLADGEPNGVLALYAGEVGFFDDDEMKLLLELAGDIAFALDHIEKANKLDYLAYYDQLTGLANRTLFQERLTQHIHAAANAEHKVAVVVADIERFRMINDSLGRQAGDELLKQVADRLAHVVDRTEIARIGTDHFAIVLPEMKGRSEIGRTLEDIWQKCLDEPYMLGETEIRIALKGGIALFPGDGKSADTLFRNAEAAWKNAKLKGERYLFHAQEMTARIAEKLTLEIKLRQALENEEFVLFYQPKVELETRRIVGVEGLIRWQSPERGLVPPGLFIPLLEETGLILEVGAWALRRAVLDHQDWLRQGLTAPRIAVNVSQIQMRQRNFVDVVREAIAQGAQPAGIDLEITESLLMEDIAGNIEKLKAVRDLELKIAIDDFGTGYSSLGYLSQLPVHTLKIDRSFIMKMLNDPNAMTLVQTIITLAHSLRLSVVAEGVEQEDQAKMLRLLRCDEMQGYLFSKPVPMEDLTALLRASK